MFHPTRNIKNISKTTILPYWKYYKPEFWVDILRISWFFISKGSSDNFSSNSLFFEFVRSQESYRKHVNNVIPWVTQSIFWIVQPGILYLNRNIPVYSIQSSKIWNDYFNSPNAGVCFFWSLHLICDSKWAWSIIPLQALSIIPFWTLKFTSIRNP